MSSEKVTKPQIIQEEQKTPDPKFEDDNYECPICLNIMIQPTKARPCNHRFCIQCLTKN